MRIYKTAPSGVFTNIPVQKDPQFMYIMDDPEKEYIHKPITDIIPITVCVNYDDFLELSLKTNRRIFDKYIVITSPEDEKTQRVCEKYDVDCRIYQDFYKNAKFNKSGAIHWVQKDIHEKYPDKWVLILDSDIVLSPGFAGWFSFQTLNKYALYGIYRKNFETPGSYNKNSGYIIKEPICIGYFQLYYDKTKFYPEFSESASMCDIFFRNLFKTKTYLTRGKYVSHLGFTFTNHGGRVSARWE